MRPRGVVAAWARAAAVAAALVLAGCAAAPGGAPLPAGTAETWADYSLMFREGGNVLWTEGRPASRYLWKPVSDTESHIYWGEPVPWPPAYHERFVRAGEWVMLLGWWDNGTYYRINTTEERLCDAACDRCSDLPTGGAQHYVRWQVPSAPYCLKTEAILTEESSGKTIRFRHEQRYTPSAPCDNATLKGQRCISQRERWWDDNRTPFALKLDRVNFLAAGLGMGFAVQQTVPSAWTTEMRNPVGAPAY